MSRTIEQLTAAKELTAAAQGYRVIADSEGWPLSPGRYGRLEHLGAGTLAAFTDRRLIRGRLLALPGVTPCQTGDTECRVLVTSRAVPAVAELLRCHRKRTGRAGSAAHLARHTFKAALGVTPGAQEPTGGVEVTR